MRRARAGVIILAMSLFSRPAQSGKKPQKAGDLGSELRKAPAITKLWRNPYAGQTDAILAGKKLYQRYCVQCHGADGRGQEKAPDLHSAVIQNA